MYSFPVPTRDNILLRLAGALGVVTGVGEPMEFALAAGSEADVEVFKDLESNLPEGRLDRPRRQGLHRIRSLGPPRRGRGELKAQRKKNSNRPMPIWEEFLGKSMRQYIKTVFSGLSALFSRKIHAVTPTGLELKVVCFLLAFSIQCL